MPLLTKPYTGREVMLTDFRRKLMEGVIEIGARPGKCITYTEAAAAAGRPGMLGHHLAYPLGDISWDCARRGEPMLSSIVVGEYSEEPGEGFWKLVAAIYRTKPHDRKEFLVNMQESVFRYWGQR